MVLETNHFDLVNLIKVENILKASIKVSLFFAVVVFQIFLLLLYLLFHEVKKDREDFFFDILARVLMILVYQKYIF